MGISSVKWVNLVQHFSKNTSDKPKSTIFFKKSTILVKTYKTVISDLLLVYCRRTLPRIAHFYTSQKPKKKTMRQKLVRKLIICFHSHFHIHVHFHVHFHFHFHVQKNRKFWLLVFLFLYL